MQMFNQNVSKLVLTCAVTALFNSNVSLAEEPTTFANAKVVLSKPKLSEPFIDLAKPLPLLSKARKDKLKKSGEKIPGVDFVREVPNKNHPLAAQIVRQNGQKVVDKVLQKSSAKQTFQNQLAPQVGFGFDGMGNIQGVAPPDTNADVGPNHIVQMVNTTVAVWDKSGNQLLAPVAINSLWSGFGGLCESTNQGDPIVIYDSLADRWFLSQFAFNGGFTDNHQCIAVSQTGDPTGAYYLYDFLWSTTKFNDYPHFGIWHDGYYAGINQFIGDNYAGAAVVVYERDKMLSGQPARQIKIDLENSTPDAFTPMPADIDGIFLPPTSMPQYFVSASGAADTIDVWNFAVDWTTPANSTFTHQQSLAVSPYDGAVCGFDRNCVSQPNAQKLDAISQRMMFRLGYRNLNGTQHKLVANHTVVGSNTDTKIAGVRWYEIDVNNDTGQATIANQGTYNPDDGNSRWMASAAMDAVGNIGIAYSVSGSGLAPSIRMSGRQPGDPINTLTVAETELKTGGGSQSGANRWGDYSSLSIDPTDDCTMWYTSEYYKAENDNTTSWSTDIRSFKFDNCVAGPAGLVTGVVTDSTTGQPIERAEVSVGSFKVLTNAQGVYKLTLPAANDYQIQYFKYGWNATLQTNVDVAEDATVEKNTQLVAATPIVVNGTVSDGGGVGGGLYSEIIAMVPGATLTTFTDSITGQYELTLFGGTLIKLNTVAQEVGYINQSVDLDPATQTQQNFSLAIDQACTAMGYQVSGFIQSFESGVPPALWSVDDVAQSGSVWQSTAQVRGNVIGTSGEAAIIDSDAAGEGVATDSSLYTPILVASALPSLTLEFDTLYRPLNDSFDLELSVDGGAWVSVLRIPGNNIAEHHSLDLTADLVGATSFQLRWHFYNAVWTWYALVDNAIFSGSECLPDTGVFVQGFVVDNNTQLALNDVNISSQSTQVVSRTTPQDDNLADGYFKLFVKSTAPQAVTASRANYASKTIQVNAINRATPIALDAGKIEVDAQQATFTMPQDAVRTNPLVITNAGNVEVAVNLFIAALPTNQQLKNLPTGPFHSSSRHFGPKALAQLDTQKIRHRSDFESRHIPSMAIDFVGQFSIPLTSPWGIGINQDTGNLWIGDVKEGGAAADELHQFSADGLATRKIIDTSSISGDFAADVAFNNRTGMLWQVEVGNDNCIHELNPTSRVVTGNKICPAFGVSQRGLTYDPLTNTFYSGSWNDSIIHQFTLEGEILRSVNVDLLVSGLAFNPSTGSLFVLSNDSAPAFDVVVLDSNTENLDAITSFNFPTDIDLDGDFVADDTLPDLTQSGLAIDCAGNLWTPSKNFLKAIAITSGELDVCDWRELSWLSLNTPDNLTIAANSSAEIELGFWTTGLDLGIYQAQLIISGDTPYGDQNSLITLNVTPPNYGTLQFQVSNVEAAEESELTLLVERIDGADQPVSINFATQDGTAIAGEDYTLSAGILVWSDQDAETKSLVIPIAAVHKDKAFSVILSSPEGATLGASSTVLIAVKDKPKGSGSLGLGFLMLLIFGGYLRNKSSSTKFFKG